MAYLPSGFWSRDSVAGLGIATIGAVFAVGSLQFGIGSLTEMGAGFFPFAAGLVAVALGIAVLVGAISSEAMPIARPAFRSLAYVAASVIVFALTIGPLGLIPAVLLCGAICGLADKTTKLHQAVVLAAGLAAGIWVVFVLLLGMPIPAFPGA